MKTICALTKKKFLTFFILTVTIWAAPSYAQNIVHFHRTLNESFRPATDQTVTQQLIYGTVEAVAIYQLGNLITKADVKSIANVQAQIALVRESDLPATARDAKVNSLKREMRRIEGNIAQRSGRGTVKLLVRGAQLFLILDIGARLYVLNALENKDPSYVPINTIFCSQFECFDMAESVMTYGNQSYIELRENLPKAIPRTRVSPPPAPTPAPTTPAAPDTPVADPAPPAVDDAQPTTPPVADPAEPVAPINDEQIEP